MSQATPAPQAPQAPQAPPLLQHHFQEIPHPGLCLGELLFSRLKELAASSTHPCQIFRATRQALSFSEFLRLSVRAALGLRGLGLRRGDALAVYCRNTADVIPVLAGAIFEGITTVLINPVSTDDELRRYLSLTAPRALLSEAGYNSLRAARCAAPGTLLLVTGEEAEESGTVALGSLGKDPEGEEYHPAHITDWHEHVTFIHFSSGTTGMPKAVAYSNAMLVYHSSDPSSMFRVHYGERFLLTSWLSWTTGTTFNLVGLLNGATRILDNFTNVQEAAHVIEEFEVSFWFIAPPMLILFAEAVRDMTPRPDLRTLRVLVTGGGALTADKHRFIMEATGAPVRIGYGCTEVPILAADTVPPRPGSSGRPASCLRMRLVDVNTGKDVTVSGVLGEVRAKSQICFQGYVGNPEATADAFDEQGYYCTGDLAFFDEDGYLFVVDRIKELIKYNSWEMAPAELEGVLQSHPDVLEACVVGTPHPKAGELPTAFVVRRPGAKVTTEALQKLVEDRLSDFKRLRGGVFLQEEPLVKNSNGKLDRRHYRQRLQSQIKTGDQ